MNEKALAIIAGSATYYGCSVEELRNPKNRNKNVCSARRVATYILSKSGLTYREIAVEVGITRPSVGIMIYRVNRNYEAYSEAIEVLDNTVDLKAIKYRLKAINTNLKRIGFHKGDIIQLMNEVVNA